MSATNASLVGSMQLNLPEIIGGGCRLVVPKLVWPDVCALAKFACHAISYDAHAPYVRQVFVYVWSLPQDTLASRNFQEACAAVGKFSTETARGDVTIELDEGPMRQLLLMLSMAAESEDQAELVYAVVPDQFPHPFPDLDLAPGYYADTFESLINKLRAGAGSS